MLELKSTPGLIETLTTLCGAQAAAVSPGSLLEGQTLSHYLARTIPVAPGIGEHSSWKFHNTAAQHHTSAWKARGQPWGLMEWVVQLWQEAKDLVLFHCAVCVCPCAFLMYTVSTCFAVCVFSCIFTMHTVSICFTVCSRVPVPSWCTLCPCVSLCVSLHLYDVHCDHYERQILDKKC